MVARKKANNSKEVWIFDIRPSEVLQTCGIGVQRLVAGKFWHVFNYEGNNTSVTLDMAAAQAIILQ